MVDVSIRKGLYYVQVWTNGVLQVQMGFYSAPDAQKYVDCFSLMRESGLRVDTIQFNTVDKDSN